MSKSEQTRRPQVRLGTLLLLMTLAAVAVGWWADHRRLSQQLAAKDVEIRMFSLRNVEAKAVATLLVKQFPDSKANPTRIDADPRLNGILVSSDADRLEKIEAVLLKLDSVAPPPTIPTSNGP